MKKIIPALATLTIAAGLTLVIVHFANTNFKDSVYIFAGIIFFRGILK